MKRSLMLFSTLGAVLGSSLGAHALPILITLGDLPGGTVFSQANGISANGLVVAGRSISTLSPGPEAFGWDTGVLTGLGDLPGGGGNSFGLGVSGDGAVIVGQSGSTAGVLGEAFRWTSSTGIVGLSDLDGGDFLSEATGANSDGTVIVGFGTSASGKEAFRWTPGDGMVGLGDLDDGGFESRSYGVSADGGAIAGSGMSASGRRAFLWTPGGGMINLGTLGPDGSSSSDGFAISADGLTVVGSSLNTVGDTEAFRWTAGGGMVGLGDLAGGAFFSIAYGASATGGLIVGTGTDVSGLKAAVWAGGGPGIGLFDYLVSSGADVTGWSGLTEALAVSADGTTITGYGLRTDGTTQAFYVTDSDRFGLGPNAATAPEPAAGALLLLGLVARRIARRRR